MTYFSSVVGASVIEGSLLIPLVGMWTADLYLASDQSLSGSVPVVIGNLTLQGSVIRSQSYGGQTRVRLVGGAGGWRKEVGAQGYGSGAGVLLSTVLGDVAQACGESIAIAADRTIGPGYARWADVASDVLWQLLGQGILASWYVDPKGVTQVKPWPTTTVTTPFTVTDQRPDEGVVVVATEDYAAWLPGSTFVSPLVAGTLTNLGAHYIWQKNGKFRFEVMTGADNFTASFDAIVAKSIAPTRFYGRYGYTIRGATNSTVDADPKNTSLGLPDLLNVPIRGDSISTYVPPIDSDCHIAFLDGVPTQPICVWTAGAPTIVELAGGSTPVARMGDTVTITQAQFAAAVPVAVVSGASGPVTISGPMQATITTGSGTVGSA